ncbi:ferredoxin [Saccharomonospora marina XMU15]|uniref:Ferredoxin n=1 Tax=Saccharomonospora marina XMU15 TaxID=882083 RepID=H5XAU6_9PSEU|nr:ferredoxin [Saccharomonospora marina]EHR52656.1 ferredoxin [Saccharomonospora marina XMU15]
MRIHVDMDLCQSHGQCVFASPEVFSFDDDDNLVHAQTPDETLRDAVVRAAAACPVRAIRIDGPERGDASGEAVA